MAIASSIVAAGLAGAAGLGAAKIAAGSQKDYAETQQQVAGDTGVRLDAIYGQTRSDINPTINVGNAAANQIMTLMGGDGEGLSLAPEVDQSLYNRSVQQLMGAPLTYDQLTKLPGWDAMTRASSDAVRQAGYATGRSGGAVINEIADRARRDAYTVYNTEMDRRRQSAMDLMGVYNDQWARGRTENLDTYGSLMNLMNSGSTAALNAGSLGSGNATNAGRLMMGVPYQGSPMADTLGYGAGFFSGSGGQDLVKDVMQWWKGSNGKTFDKAA